MKLHDSTYSGHCHRVRLMSGLLGLEFELAPVDMKAMAHKSPAYLKLNPFGQVPTLEDGDVVLRDSNAIILYLAERYDTTRRFLPTDPIARAHVYEWLATAAGPVYQGIARARAIRAYGRAGDLAEAHRQADILLHVMNDHLTARDWLVGDGPTLADVACYSYTSVAGEGQIDLGPFAHVRAWLARVEALDGFVPMPRLPQG